LRITGLEATLAETHSLAEEARDEHTVQMQSLRRSVEAHRIAAHGATRDIDRARALQTKAEAEAEQWKRRAEEHRSRADDLQTRCEKQAIRCEKQADKVSQA